MNKLILILALTLTASFSFARTKAETKDLMKRNTKVRCEFTLSYLLQTKEGYTTPDKTPEKVVLFANQIPKASSSSDFATYSLSWNNDQYAFYYYMNSQSGEIRIKEKKDGVIRAAESSLDISDMEKTERILGTTNLTTVEDIQVTHPLTKEQVDGERYTYLKGRCIRNK